MLAVDDLLTSLTPEQSGAAIDNAREVLCLACAGSGKSRTLAYRTARLLLEGADPRGIVAFTFTDKAAEAIKQRIAEALARAGIVATILGAMYVGTIHSYCQRVLRKMDAKYRQFDVLDTNRLVLYLISRYPQLGLQPLRNRARGGSYFDTVRQVASAWTTMNDEMIELAEVQARDAELGLVLENLRDGLNRDNFIDFSLMIRLVADAFKRGDAAALDAIQPLQHLMVDEYQDINPAQEVLIENLHQHSESLFVVGDDDQAIYAWRGADVQNIIDFPNRYTGASVHPLSHNFRSTEAIVRVADEFVAATLGATRLTKDPTAENPPGPRHLGSMWFDDRDQEAEWVARRIHDLIGTAYQERDGTVRGLTAGDFAILMRSTRSDEQDDTQRHTAFTQALTRYEIHFSLEAGGGLFERTQVQVLRNAFELLRDRSPSREYVRAFFDEEVVPSYPDADFEDLARVFAKWGAEVHTPPGGSRRRVYPQQLVHDLLQAFGIADTGFDSAVMNDIGVFSRIIQDVEAVYVSVDSAGRFQEILNFLQNVADSGYDTATDDLLQRPDAVTVATVHKMKGLEFPGVFVADVEAQRFPARQSNYQGWLPQDLMADAVARGRYVNRPAQEARLFYTALTRAERYLYVTGAESLPGGVRAWKRSSFALRLNHDELVDDPNTLPVEIEPYHQIPRVDEAIVPTSYSDIRYYLRCPKDYEFRKRFGFSPAIPELFGFGMTVHASVGKLHELYRDRAPTGDEAEAVAFENFHVKHVPPSTEPDTRPGAYENARLSSARMNRSYAENYAGDFTQLRQIEVPFEIPANNTVISGAIDLLFRENPDGSIAEAQVLDFKTMEGGDDPEANEKLHWTELSLQVQLYAKAARDVLNENARTGSVHLLKDGQRINIPISDEAVANAVQNVEWAISRILERDFPRRPHPEKCRTCDFQALCPRTPENFKDQSQPPPIYVPGTQGSHEEVMARAFSEFKAS